MGYRENIELKKIQKDKIDKIISLSRVYCNLKGVYLRLKIAEKINNSIKFDNDLYFASNSLLNFLNNSKEIFLIGVTSGKEIVEYRDKLSNEDLLSSVIADAVGSELTESMAEWLHGFLSNLVAKEGLKATKKRYSPGYGDFGLENQKMIYDLLEFNKLDVKLLDNYILIPEKSITAIIGIE